MVVDVLASTAERLRLFSGSAMAPVLVEPLQGFAPDFMGQLAKETISIASDIIGQLGGLSLAYRDGQTGQISRQTAYGIASYDPGRDKWAFIANPHGMQPIGDSFVEVACSTDELRIAYLDGRLADAADSPLHPREP